MSKLMDLTGQTYGRLTVKFFHGRMNKWNAPYWNCSCSCGTDNHLVTSNNLRVGAVMSCGCLRVDRKANLQHGMTRTKEYRTWSHIKDRCHNPKDKAYYKYGAKGVSVCDRWLNCFENFFADMGLAPSPSHSIERNNVRGNYEPQNCRWATQQEQANNKRNTVLIEYKGQRKPLRYWCNEMGLPYERVRQRMHQGWTFERSISETSFIGKNQFSSL